MMTTAGRGKTPRRIHEALEIVASELVVI